MAPAKSAVVQSKSSTQMTLFSRDEPAERPTKRKREQLPREASTSTKAKPTAYLPPPPFSSCPVEDIILSDDIPNSPTQIPAQESGTAVPSSPPPLPALQARFATRVARAPSITCPPPSSLGLLEFENQECLLGSGHPPTHQGWQGHIPQAATFENIAASSLAVQERLQQEAKAKAAIIEALTKGITDSLQRVQHLHPSFANETKQAAVRFFNNILGLGRNSSPPPPRSYAEAAASCSNSRSYSRNSGNSGNSGSSSTSGTSGNSGASGRSGTSGNSGASGRSGTSGNSGASGRSGTSGPSSTARNSPSRSSQSGTSGTAQSSAKRDDRIFIRAAAGSKAAATSPWAVREQLGELKQLILGVKKTPSGFAIIPRGPADAEKLRAEIPTIAALFESRVEPATTWFTYILAATPTKLRNFDGQEEDVTEARLAEAAEAATGMKPVHAAWSKHSDPALFERDVVLSFAQELPRSFRLLDASRPSRAIIRKPKIQQCTRCHGYHSDRSCRSVERCSRCGYAGHQAAACTAATPRCRSCNAAHDSRDLSCPLRPVAREQDIIHPSRMQRFNVRKVMAMGQHAAPAGPRTPPRDAPAAQETRDQPPEDEQ